jgi:thiol-disulfide isomerase/thioredoxin
MRLGITLAVTLLLLTFRVAAAPQAAKPADPPLIDAQGYQKILEQHRGQPLLVNFWATWCEPCRDEYPLINELAKQYASNGLQVVGVNFDEDGDVILMRRFLARYKPIFPNYRKKHGGNAEFAQATLPQWKGSLPVTLFYDRDGHQIAHFLGAGNRERFDKAIHQLLAANASAAFRARRLDASLLLRPSLRSPR